MVLVQEVEDLHEHAIYYISWNLIYVELHYTHVEKLALATIHAIQHLRHYILLHQTFIVAHINPFYFVLTWRMIGGNTISGLWYCKSLTSSLFQKIWINHWFFLSLALIFRVWMKDKFMSTCSLMSTYLSSRLLTHDMETSLSTCKIWRFLLTSHGMSLDDYVMYQRIASLWITLCTTMELIPFCVFS